MNGSSGLRRIDWRFLIPSNAADPLDHVVVLGGSAHVATLLLATGTARRVSRTLGGDPADLVAVLAGAAPAASAVAGALVPGGVVWWEVERRSAKRFALSPPRFRALLHHAGFSCIASYWAKGGHDGCSMYLPLDSPGALAWYFESLFRTHTALRRWAQSAFRSMAPERAQHFARSVPAYGVVARLGSSRTCAPAVVTDGPLPDRFGRAAPHALMVLGGQGDWSRVVLLPFDGDGPQPAAIVKLPRVATYNAETEHEQWALGHLRDLVGPPGAGSLPAPLGSGCWRGLSVTMESRVPGRSIHAGQSVRRGLGGAVDDLRVAGAWLREFHRLTLIGRTSCGEQVDSLVREPLARYADLFGITSGEARLFDALRARVTDLASANLPRVWQHRDFTPWNVYRANGAIMVIDWEVAREGPPLCDLLYFVMHWLGGLHGSDAGARERNLAMVYLPGLATRGLSGAVHGEIRRYEAALELDPGLRPVLLVSTLVGQALDRADRLRRRGTSGPALRTENPYVTDVGSLARHREKVFAPSARR